MEWKLEYKPDPDDKKHGPDIRIWSTKMNDGLLIVADHAPYWATDKTLPQFSMTWVPNAR